MSQGVNLVQESPPITAVTSVEQMCLERVRTMESPFILKAFTFVLLWQEVVCQNPGILITTLEDFCVKVLEMTSMENCTCKYFRSFPEPPPPMCAESRGGSNMTLDEYCTTVVGMTSLENCSCSYLQSLPLPPPPMCSLVIPTITSLKDFCTVLLRWTSLENCTCDYFAQFPGDLPPMCATSKPVVILLYDALFEKTCGGITLSASVLGIFGNTLIVWLTVRKRKDLGTCKVLIGVLAACDLLFCVFQLLFTIPRFWTSEWIYGQAMCKTFSAFLELGALWGVGTIVIIATERYAGIVHPFSSGLSQKVVTILMLANMFVGVCWVIPILVVLKLRPDVRKCEEHWSHRSQLTYSWLNLLVYFTLPVCLISFLYIRIMSVLYSHSFKSISIAGADVRLQERRSKENKRVMLLLVSILIAFVALVLPNRLAWVIYGHKPSVNREVLDYFVVATYPFHAMINPVIYTLVDPKLRREAMAMMCWFLPKTTSRATFYEDSTSTTPLPLTSTSSLPLSETRYSTTSSNQKMHAVLNKTKNPNH